jgi:hypothetical protein
VFNKKILNLFISVHLTYEGMRIRVQVLRRAFQILWRENGSLRRNLMEARRENRRLSNLMFNFEFWCFDTVSITVLVKYKTRSLRGRGVLSEIRSKTSSLFTRNLKKIGAVGYYKILFIYPSVICRRRKKRFTFSIHLSVFDILWFVEIPSRSESKS